MIGEEDETGSARDVLADSLRIGEGGAPLGYSAVERAIMDTTRQTAADRVHIELMDHAVLRRADIDALERSTRQTGASWNGASVASRPQTDMPSLTHRKRGESIRGARTRSRSRAFWAAAKAS